LSDGISARETIAGLPDFSWDNTPKAKNIPKSIKYHKWPENIPNGCKIDQMVVKYTIIFHRKPLQNLPKLGFLV
jgi:hypothetical protein